MWLFSLLALSSFAAPQAFVGADVHPVGSEVIADAVVIIDGDEVVAVGPRMTVEIPDDAVIYDVSGKVIIPGLVDTHSHVAALSDLNDSAGPLLPELSAVDAIDATHASIQRAQAGGVTTANIMPGSGNLMGGQTAYVKLRDALTVDELLICGDRDQGLCGGMKMANGTNPQRRNGGYPSTRMRAAYQQRTLFDEAVELRDKRDAKPVKQKRKKDPPWSPPPPNPRLDPVVEVLDGERIVHFHTHRLDDVVTALRLKQAYDFELVLHHVTEARKAAPLIAAAGVPVSLIIVDAPGGKEEAVELSLDSAGVLERAGVEVSIHTDDPILDSRLFLRTGAMAVRGGMSEVGALRALTLSGAKMLGLDGRIGSLEVGKDADLVVLSGPPFSVYTHVLETWVDGVQVFDREDPDQVRFATGGDAVGVSR